MRSTDRTTDRFRRNRTQKIRRSTLIVPGNVEKYVLKAFERGADAVQLDLEDSVSPEHKEEARQLVGRLLDIHEQSTTEINVRINNDGRLWDQDVQAIVSPKLGSITLPKCEDQEWIVAVAQLLDRLERERGIPEGSIELSILIETAKGFLQLDKLLQASPRISTVTLGNEDFCLDLGIEPSDNGDELVPYYMQVILYARVHEVMPLGMVSSISDFQNLERFKQLARRSKQLGFMGSSCIHPLQVAILNEVYSPSDVELVRAQGIVGALEEAQRNGRSSCSYQGKMIDPPIYERALQLLDRAQHIHRKKVQQ
ncbi:Malyl-CoA lyase [compost metagenome]